MASNDKVPVACPASTGEGKEPMGDPTKTTTAMLDKGTAMFQSMKPIKQMSLHVCSFACYSHDPGRQIEVHMYGHRVNQDFLQCAVYDSNSAKAHLIGIEYIVSEKLFESLSPDEQKLWHSHDYEIQMALLVTPRVPELVAKPELKNLAKSYGKFWCTWQIDRGDRLPLGTPSLMVSPQDVSLGRIKPELVKKRDEEHGISTESLKPSREGICGPEKKNLIADYWVRFRKGFAIDVVETDMKRTAPFPSWEPSSDSGSQLTSQRRRDHELQIVSDDCAHKKVCFLIQFINGIMEEVKKKYVYSVWALPDEETEPRFRKLMEALRSEFSGPRFDPHVTVVGATSLTAEEAKKMFESACDGLKAYTATVDRVSTGTFFYQCVFLLLKSTPEVMKAGEHCKNHFKCSTTTPYMPHLSLLYAELDEEGKKKAQEKAYTLDNSLDGLSFRLNRLALCKTDTEDKTLESWEKVAVCNLNP
ncbi:unnamed protein product [Brassica oleracea var. botrytis]|uniref:(rape) hypothetical protein n=2 Tax=Brassica TaxID=3705 RepID=A0A816R5E1_BRANA|nr:unnamed protein product [Brassica napus]